MAVHVLQGDCRDVLRTLPAESVHCVVTSPPYFGLRDYGVAGQIGLEATPEAYVAELVGVFREVRRVLRRDGTLWLNLGDSFAGGGTIGRNDTSPDALARRAEQYGTGTGNGSAVGLQGTRQRVVGLKPKDLIGIPWMVAFALRADGWYLRSDIIWAKPNPMPESVTDRPTKAHEYVFLLSRSAKYFYDAEAIAEPLSEVSLSQIATFRRSGESSKPLGGMDDSRKDVGGRLDRKGRGSRGAAMAELAGRNRRSVWTVATAPFSEAHFATFPPALIEPCIKAGVPERCCAKCGAPWVREVERFDTGRRQKMADGWDTGAGAHGTIHRNGREQGAANTVFANRTLGFSPSCACEAGTVPGTVLDCFGGAGTTGLVADRLQRNAILIELNGEYAGMSEKRLSGDRGPLLDLMEACI